VSIRDKIVVSGSVWESNPQRTEPGKKKVQPVARIYQAGDEITIGTIKIVFTAAYPITLNGVQFGQSVSAPELRNNFTVENTSAVKVVDWRGWQGDSEIRDEHGNVFRPFTPSRHFLFFAHAEAEADAYDASMWINPGQKLTRHIYFQAAPPSSKQASIELPLSVLDRSSTAKILVRLDIKHPPQNPWRRP
jgi:hypothetical protein